MNCKITENNPKSAIIIGAGWSGLACAVTLAKHGFKVIVLESARQTGGRARKVKFKNFLAGQAIDNGQHIMLGAYHSTLKLFEQLGIKEHELLKRQPLELNMYSPDKSFIQLKTPTLPAPLHLLFAFLRMKGLNLYERLIIIKMALKLAITGYQLKQDMSVSQLLKKHHQTSKIINALWEPLCLATMNTPIHYASAQVFLNVLKDSFSKQRKDSDLLFFRDNLSQIFCSPASDYITQHGGNIKREEKVLRLEICPQNIQAKNNRNEFLIKTTKQNYKCPNVVIATSAYIADKLLQNISEQKILKPANASLNYHYEPICTVYLQYPESVKLPNTMMGFIHTTAQWAIDRSLTKQPGLIAVIISGPGNHTRISHAKLAEVIHHELSDSLTNLPDFISYQIIFEKRATFSCRVNIEQLRPENETNIPGLFLAGDYTNTHYPSTLEGAIRSGLSAAQKIIDRKNAGYFTL